MEKKFGELSREEQHALFDAYLDGKEIEVITDADTMWRVITIPCWSLVSTYRIKPVPLTKPSIDWSAISKECKYLARSKSGYGYLFKHRPHIMYNVGWAGQISSPIAAEVFTSYVAGTCDWQDSLIQRPEGV